VPKPHQPERKWGPFHGGISVCVWLNEAETDSGKRWFRSITIAPRRYRDEKSGNWEDAASYRPADVPSLLLALEAAHKYCSTTPLPGEAADEEPVEAVASPNGNGDVPF
jgi:hypothetical protein